MNMALTFGLIGMTNVAWAQPLDGSGFRQGRMVRGGGPGGPDGLMLPLGQLDLDDAQREQVNSVMQQNRESHRALEEAVAADVLNEQAIRAAASALGVAQGDAAVRRAYARNQIWQLLTSEQQVRAQEIQAERTRVLAASRSRAHFHTNYVTSITA